MEHDKDCGGSSWCTCATLRARLTVPPDNGAAATRMTGVPREPTEAMCEAGARSIIDGNDSRPGTSWAEEVGMAWRAMWDASQSDAAATPQGTTVEEDERISIARARANAGY